jgi:glycosyltransferase involved in cell wall biosynthesis
LIKKIRPDIIHAHYISHFGILAGLYGWLTRFKPIVLTAWGSDILMDPKGFKKSLVKYALKKADLITCDAEHMKDALIELGTKPQKIYSIYWGTDTRKFNPEQRRGKIREDLGIFNSPTIISSKNLEILYDIESLVKSIPLVLKEVPEAKFVIAGKGSQEIVLKQLAKSLGVSDSVRFVGWIPSDEYPQYLASADIYVCTSLSDGGLAISTKEAMACGLPVVITNLEVNTEWIKDGENGFIVPLKDPKSLAEKIIYLIEHEDVRMKFGELGRKMVKEKFEYNRELKKVENIYEQLIRERKK